MYIWKEKWRRKRQQEPQPQKDSHNLLFYSLSYIVGTVKTATRTHTNTVKVDLLGKAWLADGWTDVLYSCVCLWISGRRVILLDYKEKRVNSLLLLLASVWIVPVWYTVGYVLLCDCRLRSSLVAAVFLRTGLIALFCVYVWHSAKLYNLLTIFMFVL
jgi:hypothetical protein